MDDRSRADPTVSVLGHTHHASCWDACAANYQLQPPTIAFGHRITLSSSQVYRLVVERPERLSLKILMALLDILDCTMDDLIEPITVAGAVKKPKKATASGGGEPAEGLGGLRPKRARIRGVDRP
ncbi:helix-turn-helix domain-containing protein [Kitasatospora sp. NPDC017646]|uniref:helix-turn-helix domain-containing protein n=1 Tax=Kitasatospora sp. NPDC017646 TaxID=3364024 RepID=UPI00378AB63F